MLGEGNGKPLQYSCLENPMDGGAWWATVHGVATSRWRLSDFTFTFHFHAMEKEMAAIGGRLRVSLPYSSPFTPSDRAHLTPVCNLCSAFVGIWVGLGNIFLKLLI